MVEGDESRSVVNVVSPNLMTFPSVTSFQGASLSPHLSCEAVSHARMSHPSITDAAVNQHWNVWNDE